MALTQKIQDEQPEGIQEAHPRLEDDAVSVLSELTEISELRVATNNEHSDEESEAEVSSIPRTLHRLTLAPPRFHSPRFID